MIKRCYRGLTINRPTVRTKLCVRGPAQGKSADSTALVNGQQLTQACLSWMDSRGTGAGMLLPRLQPLLRGSPCSLQNCVLLYVQSSCFPASCSSNAETSTVCHVALISAPLSKLFALPRCLYSSGKLLLMLQSPAQMSLPGKLSGSLSWDSVTPLPALHISVLQQSHLSSYNR